MLCREASRKTKLAATAPTPAPSLDSQEFISAASVLRQQHERLKVASHLSQRARESMSRTLSSGSDTKHKKTTPSIASVPAPGDETPSPPWSQRFSMPNFSLYPQRRPRTAELRPSNVSLSRIEEIAEWAEEAADALPLADYSSTDPASFGIAVSTPLAGHRRGSSDSSSFDEGVFRTSEDLIGIPAADTDVIPSRGRERCKVSPKSASCISDEPVSKRKSKGWRAWIRTTNRFREMPVAVESRVATERLVLN